jgi:anti-sigma B factor antagonist
MSGPAKSTAGKDLSIDSEGAEGRYRLSLRGELDLASAQELEQAVARLCAEGASEAVLDVAGLEFVDSTGLRAILNVKALCEQNRCAFYLTPGRDQIHDQVRRLLEITGLIDRLPFGEPDKTGA